KLPSTRIRGETANEATPPATVSCERDSSIFAVCPSRGPPRRGSCSTCSESLSPICSRKCDPTRACSVQPERSSGRAVLLSDGERRIRPNVVLLHDPRWFGEPHALYLSR